MLADLQQQTTYVLHNTYSGFELAVTLARRANPLLYKVVKYATTMYCDITHSTAANSTYTVQSPAAAQYTVCVVSALGAVHEKWSYKLVAGLLSSAGCQQCNCTHHVMGSPPPAGVVITAAGPRG
jgi:hypothetical protein